VMFMNELKITIDAKLRKGVILGDFKEKGK
jgi:hypothetical protein